MSKTQVKKIISGMILFVFGSFEIILLIRMLLKLIGASTKSSFVEFWYNLSDTLFIRFDGTISDISSGNVTIEINSLIAVIVYAVFATLSLYIVNALFRNGMEEKIVTVIDWSFKVVEAILGMRLILKLIGAGSSGFVTFLYGISSPFYKPFEGMLPHVGQGKVEFEISTFIAIIIIVILDFASDKLFEEVFKNSGSDAIRTINQRSNQMQTPTSTSSQSAANQQGYSPETPQKPTTTTVNVNYPDQKQASSPSTQQQSASQPTQSVQNQQPVQPDLNSKNQQNNQNSQQQGSMQNSQSDHLQNVPQNSQNVQPSSNQNNYNPIVDQQTAQGHQNNSPAVSNQNQPNNPKNQNFPSQQNNSNSNNSQNYTNP